MPTSGDILQLCILDTWGMRLLVILVEDRLKHFYNLYTQGSLSWKGHGKVMEFEICISGLEKSWKLESICLGYGKLMEFADFC